MEQLYLEQLKPQERKAYDIARSHLGTSFDILRSNGYKSWIKKQESTSPSPTPTPTPTPTPSSTS